MMRPPSSSLVSAAGDKEKEKMQMTASVGAAAAPVVDAPRDTDSRLPGHTTHEALNEYRDGYRYARFEYGYDELELERGERFRLRARRNDAILEELGYFILPQYLDSGSPYSCSDCDKSFATMYFREQHHEDKHEFPERLRNISKEELREHTRKVRERERLDRKDADAERHIQEIKEDRAKPIHDTAGQVIV